MSDYDLRDSEFKIKLKNRIFRLIELSLHPYFLQVVGPMSREMVPHPALNMHRIYSSCQTFTATGRVALHEPNIQVTFQAAFILSKSKCNLESPV